MGMKNVKLIRFSLILNAVAFIVLGAIMSGATTIDLSAFGGLIQKLLAASSFLPSSVLAGIALMDTRSHRQRSNAV